MHTARFTPTDAGCRLNSICPRTSAIQSATGSATRSLSKRPASTTRRRSTASDIRTATSCESSNASAVATSATSTSRSRSTTRRCTRGHSSSTSRTTCSRTATSSRCFQRTRKTARGLARRNELRTENLEVRTEVPDSSSQFLVLSSYFLLRKRIRPALEFHQLARVSLAALRVERRAGCVRRVDSFALPAGVRVVDAAVHTLREETHRIRHAECQEFAVDERQQPFRKIARRDGDLLADAEQVEPIDEVVVDGVGAAAVDRAFVVRPGQRI